jgi:hypothetical protein
MKSKTNYLAKLSSLIGLVFGIMVLLLATHAQSRERTDSLYIGDVGDDTVKRFNARTGEYLGQFVSPGSGGLNGPRGLIFAQGRLLLVNQNVDQNFAGEILGYRRDTGAFLNAVVPCNPPLGRACDPNGPSHREG